MFICNAISHKHQASVCVYNVYILHDGGFTGHLHHTNITYDDIDERGCVLLIPYVEVDGAFGICRTCHANWVIPEK